MGVLRAAYPHYYREMGREELVGVVNLWADMFADDDFHLVQAAVKQYIITDAKQFRPPHIGAIKEALAKLQAKGQMTEAEAWGYVSNAIKNSLYSAQEEFDKLPPVVQRLVGLPSQLRDWAMMPVDEVQTVVASNFQRSFRARSQSELDNLKLPQSVKEIAGRLSDGIKMPKFPTGGDD